MKHPSFALVIALLWTWAPLCALDIRPFIGRPTTVTGGSNLPLMTTVLAWYALETSGSDTSGQSRTLSAVGTPAHSTMGGGRVGECFANDNANEWYSRTAAAWMSPDGDFSVACWIKTADATPGSADSLFSHYNSTGNIRAWRLNLDTTGTITFIVSSDGTAITSVTSTATVSDNTWTFVVAVFKASTSMQTYVNNVAGTANTTSIPASVYQNSTQSLAVATSASSSGNTFVGSIDEVVLFDIALTAEQVGALYNGGNGVTFSNLPTP